MGLRESRPNTYRRRKRDLNDMYPNYNPGYNVVPSQAQPIQQTPNVVYGINNEPKAPPPVVQATPIIQQPQYYPEEYVDVIGSDSGNMTVFNWIISVGTFCGVFCTLIVLVSFMIWIAINRDANSFP